MKSIMRYGLFGKRKKNYVRCVADITTSCEDKNTTYITFPDSLRLIIRNGEYDGWYVCEEKQDAHDK